MATENTITNDRACVKCGYALRGLPPVWTCPECGKPFDFVNLPPPPMRPFMGWLLLGAPPLALIGFMTLEGFVISLFTPVLEGDAPPTFCGAALITLMVCVKWAQSISTRLADWAYALRAAHCYADGDPVPSEADRLALRNQAFAAAMLILLVGPVVFACVIVILFPT